MTMENHTMLVLSMSPESQKGHPAMFETTRTMPGGHSFPTTSMPTKIGI